MATLEEVGRTTEATRAELEATFVRGLATSTKSDRRVLEARTEEWERASAHHVASRLRAALRAADADAKDAPHALLSAYTSLHAFDRVLSLEVAKEAWTTYLQGEQVPVTTAEPRPPPPAIGVDDAKGTTALLDELARLVEDLVRTGLPSATKATRTKIDAAFEEASRRKLLRLGVSLRYVGEEVGRFLADDGTFTSRRYAFFLHRSWLLAKGIGAALAANDAALVASLAAGTGSAPSPIGDLEVVTLGVAARASTVACSFDFRLRVVASRREEVASRSLVLSFVFATKPGVPPEAYLHLPQKQGFAPKVLCEKGRIAIVEAARIAGGAADRLVLGPKSRVTAGGPYEDWEAQLVFDARGAAARAFAHVPTPLDLAVEMQEEVVLREWALVGDDVVAPGLSVSLALPAGPEGARVRERLEAAAKKKKRAPLFGTVHYERGRILLSPLTLFERDGPVHLMLSNEKINLAALLGSLDLGG